MFTEVPPRLAVCLLATLPLVLGVACSTTPGRGFSLLPQGHKLTDTAKDMRDANAHPLAVPRELDKRPLPSYVVDAGDVLLVQPADLDSPARLPSDQPVLPDGTINLGKYGLLTVSGKTVPEIEELVGNRVRAKTKDAGAIIVRIVARQSKVYYVLGEVNTPGAFQLSGRETVLDALMQAGGLTDKSSRDNIILTKPTRPNCPRVVLPVCWKAIVQLGDTTTNYQLEPGDRIYVPTRGGLECLNKRANNPCKCGMHEPRSLPPFQGASCPLPSFITPGPTTAEPLPMPAPMPGK